MKFSMLYVQSNKKYEALHKIKSPVIIQAHHVTEIFMSFLPKIELDGSRKIVISFEEKPERYKDRYIYDDYFHVSVYYVDEVTLKQLESLGPNDADMFFLNVITEALTYMATVSHAGEEVVEIIKQTAKKVDECNFELTLPIKKLTKTYQRRFKAVVYRQLNRSGELWYVEIEDKKSGNIVKYDIMKEPTQVNLEDHYKKSLWQDGCFILLDDIDQISACVKVNEIML